MEQNKVDIIGRRMLVVSDPWYKLHHDDHIVLVYAPKLGKWVFGGTNRENSYTSISIDKKYFDAEELWMLEILSKLKTSEERNKCTEGLISLVFPDYFVSRLSFEDDTTRWRIIYKLNKYKSLDMIDNI